MSLVSAAGAKVVFAAGAKVAVSIATLLLLAGCSSPAGGSERMNEAFDELMKRPNATEADSEYQSMFQTIRERLNAEVGVAAWVPDDEPMSSSACSGQISGMGDAEVRRLDAGMSPGNLPDALWDRAVAIVTEVAGQHGFGAPEVIVSGPGDHEVSFRNTYNGRLLFGTGANTILAVTTGCHLSEEAHRRGTYLPPKEY